MKAKNQLLAAAAFFLIFTSCQKDLSLKDESLTEEVSSDATANDVVETAAPVHTAIKYNVNSDVAGFWQSVPARYSSTTKKYPLIVFIHGIGELGTTLSRLNCCGLPHHVANKTFPANFNVNGVNYSFIVISPQFKVRPTAAQVQSVVDFAKRRWRIDDTRVYVTGLSMGGGSTWDWSAIYGQNAAAIVPVCGGTAPSSTNTRGVASKNVPIWALYSSADQVVPVKWGRDFISMIDASNPGNASKTKLTVWTDASHNTTWARAFNPTTKVDGMNIYQWMLHYKRGGAAAAPPVSSGTNKVPVARAGLDKNIYLINGVNRVLLDGKSSSDADGTISKYVWTKVSGPSSTFFTLSPGRVYAAHMVAGTYVFRVAVTDNKGAVATDDIRVIVHPRSVKSTTAPKPSAGAGGPTARAGGDRTIYLSSGIDRVTLDGTASSAGSQKITKYAWIKMGGPSATMLTFGAGKTYAAHLVKGTYLFRLHVTDALGRTSMDYVNVFVK